MLRKYRAPLAGFAVGIALIVGLLFSVRRPKPAPAPPPPPVLQQATPHPKVVVLQGRVEAVHVVPVSVSIAGEIDSFSADVGQEVYEGQILARISNQGLETGRDNAQRIMQAAEAKLNSLETGISAARLEAQRAHTEATRAADDLNRASKEYDRQKMLHAAGATPRNTYEKSQRDYEAAQHDAEGTGGLAAHADAHIDELTKEYDVTRKTLEDKRKELEEAQAALAATEVHAPVAGVVVSRQGDIGKTITQQEAAALFRIATDITALRVAIPLDAQSKNNDLPDLKAGDSVVVSFPEAPGEPVRAVIREFRKSLPAVSDAASPTAGISHDEAVAEFTSNNPAIRPGMNCSVHIGAVQVGNGVP